MDKHDMQLWNKGLFSPYLEGLAFGLTRFKAVPPASILLLGLRGVEKLCQQTARKWECRKVPVVEM